MAGKMLRRGFFIGLLACLAVGGYYLYPMLKAKFFSGKNIMAIAKDEQAPLFIKTGSTADQVAQQMLDEGIINDKDVFLDVAAQKNYSGAKVVPGFYLIKGSWEVDSLIIHLRGGYSRKEVQFRTDDVWTLEQLVGRMTKPLEVDSSEFFDYLTSQDILRKYGFNEQTIMALFYADKYQCNWAISKEELLDFMASKFKAFWTDDRKAKLSEMGLTQSEATTLASIVYRECGNIKNEWPIVAGLYFNRIKKGMKLQADPTAKFASQDWDAQRLYHKHTKLEHPYNTYHINGLPPGPISPVPTGVLDAVLNYKKHTYIFMCAKPGNVRGHNFASTNAEHNINANAYRAWLNKNNVK